MTAKLRGGLLATLLHLSEEIRNTSAAGFEETPHCIQSELKGQTL